jgi:hypothetical protein
LYLFVAPHDVPLLPVECHTAKVRVNGRQMEHWFDGVSVSRRTTAASPLCILNRAAQTHMKPVIVASSFFLALCDPQSTTWEPLFDGRTPTGWRTQSRAAFPSHAWKIEDSCLRSIATAPRVDLSTARRFRNFELEFEWKLAAGVNSGATYLVFGMRPNPATGKIDPDGPKALGFELQLVDDSMDADAKLAPSHSTGALYLFVAPHNVPPLPVGQWHKAKIRVNRRQMEHWLDGVSVMQADLGSESLRAAMSNQRRADIPKPHHLDELLANPAKIYPIVLTHHGGDAWFRSLRIRELR